MHRIVCISSFCPEYMLELTINSPCNSHALLDICNELQKGMAPQKATEVFDRMRREGIRPSVVSYSALISAAEKGGQWKLALEILDDMKRAGFPGNVVAYSACISALAKGQQWERALELFREIQTFGGSPSIVTYNATVTALEKGMQWELALGLFEEMKMRNLPITVVSYGGAISACDKVSPFLFVSSAKWRQETVMLRFIGLFLTGMINRVFACFTGIAIPTMVSHLD